jgi:A/G-specific adenine glycosylase
MNRNRIDPARLRRALLAFYDEEKRDLPWRGTPDPYRVWISEVMLQQTRVETVLSYYERWMRRFPDLSSLATSEQEEVLRLWQGLGYYSRARNLHRAAQLLQDRHGGQIPSSVADLTALPGLGEYTAGAVASIAFGAAVPAVDGNARRVLARLRDLPRPKASELQRIAAALVDPERPGDFNQALMELGSRVCMPRSPSCAICPLREMCAALRRGTVLERPAPRRRGKVRVVDYLVIVAVTPDRDTFVVRRPGDGLLGGMWEFPTREVSKDAQDGVLEGRGGRTGGERNRVVDVCRLPVVRHRYSHLDAAYRTRLVLVRERFTPLPGAMSMEPESTRVESEGERWVPLSDLGGLPIPVAQRKIAELARRVAEGGSDDRLAQWPP